MKRTAIPWAAAFCFCTLGPLLAGAQAPPPAVQLQVTETSVDLSRPSAVELHLQLVNHSQGTIRLAGESASLLAVGADEHETACAGLPNAAARPDALPRSVRPGEAASEALMLNADVCNALRSAKAVRVQRTVLGVDGKQLHVESMPVPVRSAASSPDAIRAMLTRQTADWNRGDLDAFAAGYKNSPDILFIGRKVSHGYDGMLANYKQGYPTREAMGALTFSDLEVQPLDTKFATVTGHFHLERTGAGGGNADGYFLLVVEETASGWKIVRDDTTALPAGASH